MQCSTIIPIPLSKTQVKNGTQLSELHYIYQSVTNNGSCFRVLATHHKDLFTCIYSYRADCRKTKSKIIKFKKKIISDHSCIIIGNSEFSKVCLGQWVRVMVFNATFNNISIISQRSVLLVEETRVPGENHRHVANH